MTESEVGELHLRIDALLAECAEHQWSGNVLVASGVLATYERQVQLLCHKPIPDSVPTLVLIMQQGTLRRQQERHEGTPVLLHGLNDTLLLRSLDTTGLDAARALLRLAEAEPSRAYLSALETLQRQARSPYAPLEFIPIRFRLARALRKLNNLPIPAQAPDTRENLPIPGDEENAP